MPIRVPRYDELQIDTTGVALPRAQGFGPDTYGASIGHVLGGISDDMQREQTLSDALNDRIEVNNQEQNILYGDEKQPGQGILKKKGLSAVQDIPNAITNFDKWAGEKSKTLGGNRKLAFDSIVAERKNYLQKSLGNFSRQEMDWHNDQTLKSTIQSSMDRIASHYTNPDQVELEKGIIRLAANNRLDEMGVGTDPESNRIRSEYLKKYTSDANTVVARAMIDNNDYMGAHDFIEKNKEEFNSQDYLTLAGQIRPVLEAEEVDNVVKNILLTQPSNGFWSKEDLSKEIGNHTKNPKVKDKVATELDHAVTIHNQDIKLQADENKSNLVLAFRANPNLTISQIRKAPEYQALPTAYKNKVENEIQVERREYLSEKKRDAADARRERKEDDRAIKEERDKNYVYYISHPEEIAQMDDREFISIAGDVSKSDFEKLKKMRDKATNGKGLAHLSLEADEINSLVERAGITDTGEIKKYGDMARKYVRAAQGKEGHQLSPDETRSLIIQGLQKVAVNTTRASFMGIPYGDTGDVKRLMEVQNRKAIMPPKVGQVIDGYKYKGGDVKSPSSWAKVAKK